MFVALVVVYLVTRIAGMGVGFVPSLITHEGTCQKHAVLYERCFYTNMNEHDYPRLSTAPVAVEQE